MILLRINESCDFTDNKLAKTEMESQIEILRNCLLVILIGNLESISI